MYNVQNQKLFYSSPKPDAIQWGGGSSTLFSSSPKADAIQWGGVVTEFFRRLQNPTRFSGGVVAEFFRRLQKPTRDSVGGGSSRMFPGSPKDTNLPLMGPFYILGLSK